MASKSETRSAAVILADERRSGSSKAMVAETALQRNGSDIHSPEGRLEVDDDALLAELICLAHTADFLARRISLRLASTGRLAEETSTFLGSLRSLSYDTIDKAKAPYCLAAVNTIGRFMRAVAVDAGARGTLQRSRFDLEGMLATILEQSVARVGVGH